MRILEALSQFIVPLIFLAIWALTSILNRDGQPLPRRPGAGPGPRPGIDPRPEDGFAVARAETPSPRRDPLAAARAEEAAASRAASGGAVASRNVEPPVPASARIGTARPPGRTADADVYVVDDEMIFVDPVTRRRVGSATIPPHPQPTNRPPRRRPSKDRRPSQPAARPGDADAETRRALSEQVGKTMARNQSQAMTNLAPLASALSGLSATSLHATTAAATVTRTEALPALSAEDVGRILTEPSRLREAVLLAEILKPPVSRRPRRKI